VSELVLWPKRPVPVLIDMLNPKAKMTGKLLKNV
jgi:hypothetical protein